MGDYNNGRVQKVNEIEDINQALIDFSEGSEALYNLLKFCYENNIETRACCKGHPGETSKAYVLFSSSALEYFSMILEATPVCDFEISYTQSNRFKEAQVAVYNNSKDQSEKGNENFFNNIHSCLRVELEQNQTRRPEVFERVDKISSCLQETFFFKDFEPCLDIESNEKAETDYWLYIIPKGSILLGSRSQIYSEKEALEQIEKGNLSQLGSLKLNEEEFYEVTDKMLGLFKKSNSK